MCYLGAGTVDLLGTMTKLQAEYPNIVINLGYEWVELHFHSPTLQITHASNIMLFYLLHWRPPITSVFSHCLTEKLKYDTFSNATYLETLLGEETRSAISSLHGHWGRHHGHANQCILPAKNCPGCYCLCHKHYTTAASLQVKLRMSSECNQIMVYSLQ